VSDPLGISTTAVCGKGKLLRGLAYRERSGEILGGAQEDVVARCPDGKKVIGGGAFSSGGYKSSQLQSTVPDDGAGAR
jgi:hypothetical protein